MTLLELQQQIMNTPIKDLAGYAAGTIFTIWWMLWAMIKFG